MFSVLHFPAVFRRSVSVSLALGWVVSLTSCSGPMDPADGETGEIGLAAGKPVKYSVTPTAEAGGTIAPNTVQLVSSGQSSVAFVSTPTTSAPNCYARNGFALDQ